MLPRQILRPALFALALVAAAPAHAADPVFPTASRIGLVAPAGFTPSTRFAGFENPLASALITLAELPADAYADVEKGFTNDEALKSRGWTIKVREPLTFKDGKGILRRRPAGIPRPEAIRSRDGRQHRRHHLARLGADDRSERARRSPMRSCATRSRR